MRKATFKLIQNHLLWEYSGHIEVYQYEKERRRDVDFTEPQRTREFEEEHLQISRRPSRLVLPLLGER